MCSAAPVKVNAKKREYCEAEFLLSSFAYLDKFDKAGINEYVNHYEKLLKDDPENGKLNLAIGICYLDLGLYDLATKFFSKAIEQIPDYGHTYYYYALALIKGRKLKVLTLTEIKKTEGYINAAIQIDNSKSKYYYLWAVIEYDFRMKDGLRMSPPNLNLLQKLISKITTGKK